MVRVSPQLGRSVRLGGPACLVLLLGACASSLTGPEVSRAEANRLYRLPYRAGTRHRVVQAGPGPFSHQGTQRHAVDFAMPVGTPVLAARSGRVVYVKEDSNLHGTSREYAKHGNRVIVEHEDGTRAVYLHLKQDGALVDVGRRVRRGEPIALSGHTGWSALPHLHFQVNRKDEATGRWTSIPVAFQDVPGDGIPAWLVSYRSGNLPPAPEPGPAPASEEAGSTGR